MLTQQLLYNNYTFYPNGKGRSIAFIYKKTNNDKIPFARNTNFLVGNLQPFIPEIDILGDFNCGFIEEYKPEYKKMAFHSDCDVDLVEDSQIGIISLYSNPDAPIRHIEFKSKLDNTREIIDLCDGELLTFSYAKNKLFTHRIIGNAPWIGITLYKSKNNNIPNYSDEEKKEFYKMQRIHNYSFGCI
jgi:hypothetical protein